jgi:hypothetical protein
LLRGLSVPSLNAAVITPAATRWLQTTRTARLLNIFDRACNVVNQDGNVLAIVTSERGLTPFGLVIAESDPSPFQSLVESSPVSVLGNRLSLGDLAIETGPASLWSPTPDWPDLRTLFAADPDKLRVLAAQVFELSLFALPGSLLDLYIQADFDNPARISPALRSRASKGAFDLVQGLKIQDMELGLKGVRLLAGLGGGLTPAGDDFIVGTLLAIWAGLYGSGRDSLAQTIVEAAAPLTTTLSAAYLRAAAQGECISHWHHLFAALQGSDPEATRIAVKSLLSIGHTSGADGLAGFLAARIL